MRLLPAVMPPAPSAPKAGPSPPKTTLLISSLLLMVLQVVVPALPSSEVLPSTLPTLATTVLRARCTMLLHGGSSGRVRRTLRRTPTGYTSIAAMLLRRATAVVAAVTPYAAPRSRMNSNAKQYYPPLALLEV